VDGLHVGHERSGGDGCPLEVRGLAAEDSAGQACDGGLDGRHGAVRVIPHLVEGRGIEPGEAKGQDAYDFLACGSRPFQFAKLLRDADDGDFAVAVDDQVEERRHGFGVVGLRPAADDEGVRLVAILCPPGDAGQVQQHQHVGIEHFVLKRDAQDVCVFHGLAGIPGEKRDLPCSHTGLGIRLRAVGSFGDNPWHPIARPIQDLAAQVAHSQGVGVGERQYDPDGRPFPVTFVDELVDLTADVLGGLQDAGEQLRTDALAKVSH